MPLVRLEEVGEKGPAGRAHCAKGTNTRGRGTRKKID